MVRLAFLSGVAVLALLAAQGCSGGGGGPAGGGQQLQLEGNAGGNDGRSTYQSGGPSSQGTGTQSTGPAYTIQNIPAGGVDTASPGNSSLTGAQ